MVILRQAIATISRPRCLVLFFLKLEEIALINAMSSY